MAQVTIDNPILNSAFDVPTRHFKFDNDGITTETEDKRRPSAFFMPIARARKKGEQAHFDTEWTLDPSVRIPALDPGLGQLHRCRR
ncbi:MAG TPA: hypothetical protein VEL51_04395 [Vicinamibacterales bacterium]|nr:hypothetical protein [Vicinamibacterales bacterium]